MFIGRNLRTQLKNKAECYKLVEVQLNEKFVLYRELRQDFNRSSDTDIKCKDNKVKAYLGVSFVTKV